MPRILMTGATGFIGSHLARHLLARGSMVAALIRPNSNTTRIADILPRLRVIPGDLNQLDSVADAITTFAPEVVIHLGWYGANSFRFQNDVAQVFENVPASLKLVQLANQSNCQSWIGLGSVLEYGQYPVPITEEVESRPTTLYAVGKHSVRLLAEKLCEVYGIRFAWLRLFWAYGPDDDPLRMIPQVIQSLLRKQKPALTPGEQQWDYLYVQDAVEAISKIALECDAHGAFNLASGQAHSIRSVVELIRDRIDPALPLGFGEMPYRPDQIMRLQGNISKLRQAIEWKPRTTLEDGLRKTIESFRRGNERG